MSNERTSYVDEISSLFLARAFCDDEENERRRQQIYSKLVNTFANIANAVLSNDVAVVSYESCCRLVFHCSTKGHPDVWYAALKHFTSTFVRNPRLIRSEMRYFQFMRIEEMVLAVCKFASRTVVAKNGWLPVNRLFADARGEFVKGIARSAWKRLRCVAVLVGMYAEVSLRPGNSACLECQSSFENAVRAQVGADSAKRMREDDESEPDSKRDGKRARMSAIRTMAVSTTDEEERAMHKNPLTARQRIALFRGILNAKQALEVPDDEITFGMLIERGVGAPNIRVAGLDCRRLKEMGVGVHGLRELGYDALDLTDAAFCSSAVSAYGVDPIVSAFLIESGDAVAMAGSLATYHLKLSVSRLLQACAGSPEQAKAVLQQSEPRGGALSEVEASVVLDSGLRASALLGLGYNATSLKEQLNATSRDLEALGFN